MKHGMEIFSDRPYIEGPDGSFRFTCTGVSTFSIDGNGPFEIPENAEILIAHKDPDGIYDSFDFEYKAEV